jgi:DnaJ-class molecular chaperone
MDIFKMANQIVQGMSDTDKESLENMDMEKMITHVTKNVFKMMNVESNEAPDISGIMNMFNGLNGNAGGGINITQTEEESSDTESESCLYPKTRDICFDLNVDLEDFYMGKKKKLNVKRKRIIEVDGKQKVVEEKKKLVIPIERGMKDEQQIRFEGEADQIPGYSPGDIIITLIENEHPVFERDGNNLIIVKNINLYELYDITFDITHLDSRVLRITKELGDSLQLDSMRKIPGEGMPIYKDTKHGDLFIRFNLIIQKSLDLPKLNLFKQIFEPTDPLQDTFTKKCVLESVSESDLESFDYSSDTSDSSSDSESSDSSDSTDSESSSDSESSDSMGSESSSESPPPRRRQSRRR